MIQSSIAIQVKRVANVMQIDRDKKQADHHCVFLPWQLASSLITKHKATTHVNQTLLASLCKLNRDQRKLRKKRIEKIHHLIFHLCLSLVHIES